MFGVTRLHFIFIYICIYVYIYISEILGVRAKEHSLVFAPNESSVLRDLSIVQNFSQWAALYAASLVCEYQEDDPRHDHLEDFRTANFPKWKPILVCILYQLFYDIRIYWLIYLWYWPASVSGPAVHGSMRRRNDTNYII